MIAVEDHGIGIPSAIKTKIFDMAGAGQRSGTAGEQPFGLGLAISRQIIETHGGKIWVESEPEKGSVFYIELPL
ncbi:Phytochrome-like protein cph1 [compost metagenome]